jgi:Zn-dependent protease
MDGTLLTAVALLPALIVAIVFHEVAHGWVALALGDPTAKEQHRLTLNPLRHVDPIGTVLLPGALMLAGLPAFGWAKPVPVNKRRLRNPRFGMMAVAAAGPLTNIVLAVLGAVVFGLAVVGHSDPQTIAGQLAVQALSAFIQLNLFLALFNLLPIPPFDGSHIVEGVLPAPAARAYARIRPFGFVLFFLVLLVLPRVFPQFNLVDRVVLPPVSWALEQVQALANWIGAHA